MIKKTIILSCFLALVCSAGPAIAGQLSADQIARLEKDLTPVGAERAGNADGTIPAWTGGLTEPLPGWPNEDNYRPNPYPNDKVLFTITKDNMDQYADKLSGGAKALLKAYPEAFKMNIYPTRRTAACPQWVYDNIKKNAATAKLVAGGDGVEGVMGSIPFPIPENGHEVIWNHLLRFPGVYRTSNMTENITYTNNRKMTWQWDQMIHHPFYDRNLPEEKRDIIIAVLSTVTAPPRDSGEGILGWDYINPAKIPRRAWQYDPGERRVRRAPNLAFDTPEKPLNVIDQFDFYSGSPERYDWKLVGKKEMYIPYNNNEIYSPRQDLDTVTTPGFVKWDLIRYELHRVWMVEATLKEGKRHLFAKRVFGVDEDSWNTMTQDMYDGDGNLWRVGLGFPLVAPEVPVTGAGGYISVDLKKDGYWLSSTTVGKAARGWVFSEKTPKSSMYTPAELRRRGR